MNSTTKIIEPVRFQEAPEMVFAGVDGTYTFETAQAGIPKQWDHFMTRVRPLGREDDKVAYGVIHQMAENGFNYLVAVETANADGLPEGIVSVKFPARRYAVFTHPGHVSTMCETIGAMWEGWLPQSGEKADMSLGYIERYGEDFDPQAMMGDIELWLPLEPK